MAETNDGWAKLARKVNQATEEADRAILDWTRPTAEMHNMQCRSGVTLRAACAGLGIPASGPKVRLAARLIEAGLSAAQVEDRYGWHARTRQAKDGTETHQITIRGVQR